MSPVHLETKLQGLHFFPARVIRSLGIFNDLINYSKDEEKFTCGDLCFKVPPACAAKDGRHGRCDGPATDTLTFVLRVESIIIPLTASVDESATGKRKKTVSATEKIKITFPCKGQQATFRKTVR